MHTDMILDIVAGTILFLSMLIAWFRGIIRETLTIFGLMGAGLVALFGSPYLVPAMVGWMPQKADGDEADPALFGIIPYDVIAIGLSYLLIFIVVFVILSLCTHWLAKTAKEAGLGALDRSLGLLFGLVRAVIFIGFLFLPFHLMLDEEQKQEWFPDSISLPYVEYTAEFMHAAIPNPLAKKDGEDGDNDKTANDDSTSEDEKKNSLNPLDIIRKKALENADEALKIIQNPESLNLDSRKPDSPKTNEQNGEKNGYSDKERDALKKLFDSQDNSE